MLLPRCSFVFPVGEAPLISPGTKDKSSLPRLVSHAGEALVFSILTRLILAVIRGSLLSVFIVRMVCMMPTGRRAITVKRCR